MDVFSIYNKVNAQWSIDCWFGFKAITLNVIHICSFNLANSAKLPHCIAEQRILLYWVIWLWFWRLWIWRLSQVLLVLLQTYLLHSINQFKVLVICSVEDFSSASCSSWCSSLAMTSSYLAGPSCCLYRRPGPTKMIWMPLILLAMLS